MAEITSSVAKITFVVTDIPFSVADINLLVSIKEAVITSSVAEIIFK